MQSPGTDLRNSFFCGTHTQTERRACGLPQGNLKLFGQSTNQLTASWGSESPYSTPLASMKPGKAGEKKYKNPFGFAIRTPAPFYASATCYVTLWKTSFISVRERLLIDNYALPSLYISLCLSVSVLQPVCLSTLLSGWTFQRKKLNIPFALQDQTRM